MSETKKQERRRATRVEQRVLFGVAPYLRGMDLESAKFKLVKTCDLSMTGIGFFSKEQVRDSEIVIVMGTHALKPIYVRAKVIHCTPSAYGAEQGYIVGCHFVERLNRSHAETEAKGDLGIDLTALGDVNLSTVDTPTAST